uniref:organic solute transporter subunit alpha-like n=1 Tax=Pristiophorus japonicus TaxID=55135 RepID=UPI00398EAC54
MESLLKSIPGTVVFQDDILITGRDTYSHFRNLEEALSRLDRDQYSLPEADDLFVTLAGGKAFMKLELTSAYITQELEESLKGLTCISTFPLHVIELIEKFNMSEACFLPAPKSINLILQLSWLDLGIFATLTAMTALSVVIYLENTYYLMKKVKCPIKTKTLVSISAAPTVIGITSCLGLWVPRAVMFINMMAAIYFGLCFYLLLLVIVEGYGGEEGLLEHFKNTSLVVSTGPCCCCCPCLPHMRMTRRKFRIFVLGAFQVAFLRPVFFFMGIVLWTNGLYDPDDLSATSIFLWMDLFLGVSTILGLWPTNILFRQSKLHMADQKLTAKFSLFQVILILSSLQNSIIGTLAGAGNIRCSPPYSSRTRGQLMNNQLLIIEMFIVGVLTRLSYRKKDDRPGYRALDAARPKDKEERHTSTDDANSQVMGLVPEELAPEELVPQVSVKFHRENIFTLRKKKHTREKQTQGGGSFNAVFNQTTLPLFNSC